MIITEVIRGSAWERAGGGGRGRLSSSSQKALAISVKISSIKNKSFEADLAN